MGNLLEQIRTLSPQRRFVLGATTAGSLLFFAWFIFDAATPDYRALFRGLAEDEVARVVDALRAEKIAYRLEDGATSVLVPSAQLYEARIRLAGKGLPSGSAAGFELFDRPAFGVTDFVHRVNYVRAVQGELARSIERLEAVERARVQVVIPERSSVLRATKRKPSAAVVVQLRPGSELGPEAVQAIVHLVASSIESLQTSDVTVVDETGSLLAPLDDSPDAPGGLLGYQARLERELAERIESIIESAVGRGRVVARVRADMDFTRSETTEERFDPDSQVARSEQRSTEQSFDSLEGGVPGVASSAPDSMSATAGGVTPTGTSRSTETMNFEISKTVSHRVTPVGRIERLSVAVLIAEPGAPEGAPDAGDQDPELLRRFELLAKQAVGFSEERGDQITVSIAPFRVPEGEFEGEGFLGPEWMLFLSNVVRALAVVLALVVFGRLVVRPALAVLSQPYQPQLPGRVSDLEAAAAGAGELPAPPPNLAAQVGRAAAVRSEDSVKTIRNWLNQG